MSLFMKKTVRETPSQVTMRVKYDTVILGSSRNLQEEQYGG